MTIPGKPLRSPWNLPLLTTSIYMYIAYGTVDNDGGSAINGYNVYFDDGMNGGLGLPIANALLITYDTSTLTTGLNYRVAYSAVNIMGEGPITDEV
jgi:hypothetical protein